MLNIYEKIAFTLLLLAGSIASMHAQAKFEHAQTRIQEGMSEFFVRPMVAELQMINKDCQEWSFNIFPGVSLSDISTAMLENAKLMLLSKLQNLQVQILFLVQLFMLSIMRRPKA